MRRPALLLACAVLLAPARPARAGAVVEGTVRLPREAAGAPKPRYPVAATYTVGEADRPAAVVYLEGTFRSTPPRSGDRATMAQRHYQFAPGLLVVQKGAVVGFPNLDDEYHSVFSYSKAKRFDLGRYHKDETPAALSFDQPGVVKLYCEIHDHMRGTIVVLDTPYFQKTDAAGRYRLEDLPAGRHVLRAWRDDDTMLEHAVELRDGATLTVDFPAP
jgi:plastocyanin